jgi:hypothetical protein
MYVALSLALLLVSSLASPAPAGCTHLFVAAGQSNMEGHGWPYLPEDITADVRIWDTNYTDGTPIPGYERFEGLGVAGSLSGATTWRGGPTFGGLVSLKGTFLRSYANNYTGTCRIMVTGCAWGGTGFSMDASNCPTPTGNMTSRTWDRLGSCRQTCVNRVAAVVSNTAMNGNVTLQAILWHQGEFQINTMFFNNYTSTMLQFIDDWRGLNGAVWTLPGATATTPFIVGGLNWVYIYSVHNGQRNPGVDLQLALAHLQDNRTNVGFASSLGIWFGGIHFSGTDLRTLGTRYYAEFTRLALGYNASRTPLPTPNCTGAVSVAGAIPSGVRAFYPLDGRLDDCGPNGLPALVSEFGFNQTVRFGVGPYPRNITSLHMGLEYSDGNSPVLVYEPQSVDLVYPTTLVGPFTDLSPIANSYDTSAFYNNTQGLSVSLWFYVGANVGVATPLMANGFFVFARGRPAVPGSAAYVVGVGGCSYSFDQKVAFPVRKWTHLVFTTYNATLNVYGDGVLLVTKKDCFEALDLRSVAVAIGKVIVFGGGTMPDGASEMYVHWVRIYDRMLSAAEVASLYATETLPGTTPSPFVSRTPSVFRYSFDLPDPLAETNGGQPLSLLNGIGQASSSKTSIRLRSASNLTLVPTPNPPPSGSIGGMAMEQFSASDTRVTNIWLPEPMLQWTVCLGVYIPIYNASVCTVFGLEFDARPDATPTVSYAPSFTVCPNNTWTYRDNSTITWSGNGSNATGIWHHICVTMNYANGSNFVVYYNGAARGSGSRGNMTARPALLGLPIDARLALDSVWMSDLVANANDILTEYTVAASTAASPTASPTTVPTAVPSTAAPSTATPSAAGTNAPTTATPSAAPTTAAPSPAPSPVPTALPTTATPTTAAPTSPVQGMCRAASLTAQECPHVHDHCAPRRLTHTCGNMHSHVHGAPGRRNAPCSQRDGVLQL